MPRTKQDTVKQKRQIALHFNTTGLHPEIEDRIIEIAALEYIDGKPTGNDFIHLVNKEDMKISPAAFAINQITKDMLAGSPTFYDLADDFMDFIKNDELIVHYFPFTTKFIDCEMKRRIDQAPEHKQKYMELRDLFQAELKLAKSDKESNKNLVKELEGALAFSREKIALSERLEGTKCTSIFHGRRMIDIRDMDEALYPKKEGFTHTLDEICDRLGLDYSIEHTAANRAKLIMQAHQQLSANLMTDEKEKVAPSHYKNNNHVMFANSATHKKRTAKNTENMDGEIVQPKRGKRT